MRTLSAAGPAAVIVISGCRHHLAENGMDLKKLLKNPGNPVLLREYDDNYYDKIRVYMSRIVKDTPSAAAFALQLRGVPGLQIERILFEDLRLREEEGALPVEESAGISGNLLKSYIAAPETDLIKFAGTYLEKRIEIGIDKRNWEVWLRIWHLTDRELGSIEEQLGLI